MKQSNTFTYRVLAKTILSLLVLICAVLGIYAISATSEDTFDFLDLPTAFTFPGHIQHESARPEWYPARFYGNHGLDEEEEEPPAFGIGNDSKEKIDSVFKEDDKHADKLEYTAETGSKQPVNDGKGDSNESISTSNSQADINEKNSLNLEKTSSLSENEPIVPDVSEEDQRQGSGIAASTIVAPKIDTSKTESRGGLADVGTAVDAGSGDADLINTNNTKGPGLADDGTTVGVGGKVRSGTEAAVEVKPEQSTPGDVRESLATLVAEGDRLQHGDKGEHNPNGIPSRDAEGMVDIQPADMHSNVLDLSVSQYQDEIPSKGIVELVDTQPTDKDADVLAGDVQHHEEKVQRQHNGLSSKTGGAGVEEQSLDEGAQTHTDADENIGTPISLEQAVLKQPARQICTIATYTEEAAQHGRWLPVTSESVGKSSHSRSAAEWFSPKTRELYTTALNKCYAPFGLGHVDFCAVPMDQTPVHVFVPDACALPNLQPKTFMGRKILLVGDSVTRAFAIGLIASLSNVWGFPYDVTGAVRLEKVLSSFCVGWRKQAAMVCWITLKKESAGLQLSRAMRVGQRDDVVAFNIGLHYREKEGGLRDSLEEVKNTLRGTEPGQPKTFSPSQSGTGSSTPLVAYMETTPQWFHRGYYTQKQWQVNAIDFMTDGEYDRCHILNRTITPGLHPLANQFNDQTLPVMRGLHKQQLVAMVPLWHAFAMLPPV
ncbi:hypothetical protein, variant, partial [Sphaeroforma arctica JP610]